MNPSPSPSRHPIVELGAEVRDALHTGRPVVALESTIISHGLPRPRNLEVAREFETIVRDRGGCPATIAVVDGRLRAGLDDDTLTRVAMDDSVAKLAMRDLPLAAALGRTGATTVSATAFIAARAGVRVFATGGIGGVHRNWTATWDESADLDVLGKHRITVVCAGVKSILDVPATLQRLETLNVTVAGYGTHEFPGFYLRRSGYPTDWRLDSPAAVVAAMRVQDLVDMPGALLLANPVPEKDQLEPRLHDRALGEALAAAEAEGVHGPAITPFLLAKLVELTDGASLRANLAAVRNNIALASDVAVAWSVPTAADDPTHELPAPELTVPSPAR
ncbi:pseudouridine-5'-phosphate glycosidase [Jatrophihabitans fulvus]